MQRACLVPLLLLLTLPVNARALTLAEAVAQGLAHSPDVRSLAEQIESAEAKKRQTLAPGDPTISASYNDESTLLAPGSSASNSYQISQPIAFPGKAFANYDVAQAQVKALQAQQRATRLSVTATIEQAYYQLALARKNLELHHALKDDYQEILAVAKRRYESGSITQVDYLNAQVTLYSDENSVHDLNSAEHNARTQLNILLGNDPDAALETEPLHYEAAPLSKDEAMSKMLDNRAEIAASRATLEGTQYSYHLARLSYLPDFELVGGTNRYNIQSASPYSYGHERTYTIGLQMTIPLWAPVSQHETVVSAEHDKSAAQENLNSLIDQSKTSLTATLDTLDALSLKIRNYEQHLLPLSQQSYKLALTNYGIGKIDFQTLSDTALSMRTMQSDYNTAIANYLIALSTYHQLIGGLG